jgi:hypothetical protein
MYAVVLWMLFASIVASAFTILIMQFVTPVISLPLSEVVVPQNENMVDYKDNAMITEVFLRDRDPVTYHWWKQQVHRFDPEQLVERRTLPWYYEQLRHHISRIDTGVTDQLMDWSRFIISPDGSYEYSSEHMPAPTKPLHASPLGEDDDLSGYGQCMIDGGTWVTAPSYPFHLGEGCVVRFTGEQPIIHRSPLPAFMGHFGHRICRSTDHIVVSAPGEGDDYWGRGRVYVYDKDGFLKRTLTSTDHQFVGLDVQCEGEMIRALAIDEDVEILCLLEWGVDNDSKPTVLSTKSLSGTLNTSSNTKVHL